VDVLIPDPDGVHLMSGLPTSVVLRVWDGRGSLPSGAEDTEFIVAPAMSAKVLRAMSDMRLLKVVQLVSAGYEDAIDQVPDGVTLCNARGVHDLSVAEWVVAGILSMVRAFPHFAANQRVGTWQRSQTDTLAGKRVLLLGYGSIATAVERRLSSFEVDIVRVARTARPDVHSLEDLEELLPTADVVVALLPHSDQTTRLVDSAFLAKMKDRALLVNGGRGSLVDLAALHAEVSRCRLRAVLDVTDPEPLPSGHPMWTAPGVLITPHVAGNTRMLLPRLYTFVSGQISRYVAGAELLNVVSASHPLPR
jgi:phosphoglycerate dehydrogenase-like enzyme